MSGRRARLLWQQSDQRQKLQRIALDDPLEIAVSNVASIDRNACPRAYPSNGAEAAGPAQARLQRFIEEQHGILLNGVKVRGIA